MGQSIISEIYKLFPTRESCLRFIEEIRWSHKPRCPHCGADRVSELPRESRYHCNNCNTSFSVTVNTLFHNTRIPLQKWFLAIDIFSRTERKISVRKLAEILDVNKNTAWAMSTKLKKAFNEYSVLFSELAEYGNKFLHERVEV